MKTAIVVAACLIQAISYQAFVRIILVFGEMVTKSLDSIIKKFSNFYSNFNQAGMDEKREMIIKSATECMKTTGASDNDLEEMMKRELPSTKPGKCMRKCLLEKFNIVSSIHNTYGYRRF